MSEPKTGDFYVENPVTTTRRNDVDTDVEIDAISKLPGGNGLDAIHEVRLHLHNDQRTIPSADVRLEQNLAVGYKEYREALDVEVTQRDVSVPPWQCAPCPTHDGH